ncbi:hypothetical protein B0H14DRAFT_3491267 [Mycena olivaceomarginata]|nr:hypothetical protein B0H14DRAFT_3491267 [Mycena olivaceomarginata]
MVFLLENMGYREFLLIVTDQKEMATCSGLAALDYANTKFSQGYTTTGVGMGVCARHEFVQPNGVGDLQKGEQFANIDYIFTSFLQFHDPTLFMFISYDIVCVWWIHLMERLMELPPLVRCFLIMPMICFVIPKLHIKGRSTKSGQTDGEGIKRPWSNIGGIAASTRIMGPGVRHDTIDDHWSHWNWQKLILLAATLRRRLDNAKEQEVIHQEALASFSEQQQERVGGWKTMVHEYEDDSMKKNPYEMVITGLTEAQVRLQFQREEEEAAKKGLPEKHRVTPSEFMTECLGVEEEQREVRVQVGLKKSQTTKQQIDLGALRTKLLPLEKREAVDDEQPENEPLYLPSALSEAERADGSALVKLHNQLVVKARFINYKALHTRHPGATTRARAIVNPMMTRVGKSRRDVLWIWKAAGSTGTDADFEDALHIEWSKVYARARRWNEEVRLLKEEFRRVPISLEFEVDRWVEWAKAVLVGTGGVDEASAQGMIAYALKQEAMYRDIAARTREVESAPKIARGKKQPRVPIVDPLAQRSGTEEGENDDNGDTGLREEDDDDIERGVMESNEELVMGGDIDNM